jgi:hypothetical protein
MNLHYRNIYENRDGTLFRGMPTQCRRNLKGMRARYDNFVGIETACARVIVFFEPRRKKHQLDTEG